MMIPQSVLDLMWEYDVAALGAAADYPDALIGRVMARGRWQDMLWLLDTVGRERLRSFMEGRGTRSLEPREIRFWAWITGVPEEQAAEWARRARQREAAWRG
jgi:hypothetical protein